MLLPVIEYISWLKPTYVLYAASALNSAAERLRSQLAMTVDRAVQKVGKAGSIAICSRRSSSSSASFLDSGR
jgi:hypothetical protein